MRKGKEYLYEVNYTPAFGPVEDIVGKERPLNKSRALSNI